MAISFNIVNYELVLTPELLLVPIFKKIYNLENQEFPGSSYILYIFYMAEARKVNPYADYTEYQKESIIKENLFKNPQYQFPKTIDILIRDGIKEYKVLNETAISKMLAVLKKKIDSFQKVIDNFPIESVDDIEKIQKLITSAKPMIDGIISLENKARETNEEKAKADAISSPLESGSLRIRDIDMWKDKAKQRDQDRKFDFEKEEAKKKPKETKPQIKEPIKETETVETQSVPDELYNKIDKVQQKTTDKILKREITPKEVKKVQEEVKKVEDDITDLLSV